MKETNGSFAEGLVFIFCSLGLIFNLLVITSCNVLNLNLDEDFQDGGFGLFQFKIPDTDQGQCVRTRTLGELEGRYSGFFWAPNDDKILGFAKVGSALAFVVGVFLFATILMRQCWKEPTKYQLIIYLCGTGVQVCLGWVYVIWWSNGCDFYSCSYGKGSTYLILTQVFWLIACLLTRYMRPSRQERLEEGNDEEGNNNNRNEKKGCDKKMLMEYGPVIVTLLIIAVLLYFALHNVNKING